MEFGWAFDVKLFMSVQMDWMYNIKGIAVSEEVFKFSLLLVTEV